MRKLESETPKLTKFLNISELLESQSRIPEIVTFQKITKA